MFMSPVQYWIGKVDVTSLPVWQARYAYRPVLFETFVEKPRFSGTGYIAVNRQNIADTLGRRKLDILHRNDQPTKSIWIYPYARDFQLSVATLRRIKSLSRRSSFQCPPFVKTSV